MDFLNFAFKDAWHFFGVVLLMWIVFGSFVEAIKSLGFGKNCENCKFRIEKEAEKQAQDEYKNK